tara:strand:- start:33 stop:320 length:288 start_codon:yes stop_codon:yes gene_type:complete
MSKKVDVSLYWSVINKNKKLLFENEELKNSRPTKKYIIPIDHIIKNNIEYRLDLSDGNFYSKSNFEETYNQRASILWDESGIILKIIINNLNKHL